MNMVMAWDGRLFLINDRVRYRGLLRQFEGTITKLISANIVQVRWDWNGVDSAEFVPNLTKVEEANGAKKRTCNL